MFCLEGGDPLFTLSYNILEQVGSEGGIHPLNCYVLLVRWESNSMATMA